jgi:hypothetical protein
MESCASKSYHFRIEVVVHGLFGCQRSRHKQTPAPSRSYLAN